MRKAGDLEREIALLPGWQMVGRKERVLAGLSSALEPTERPTALAEGVWEAPDAVSQDAGVFVTTDRRAFFVSAESGKAFGIPPKALAGAMITKGRVQNRLEIALTKGRGVFSSLASTAVLRNLLTCREPDESVKPAGEGLSPSPLPPVQDLAGAGLEALLKTGDWLRGFADSVGKAIRKGDILPDLPSSAAADPALLASMLAQAKNLKGLFDAIQKDMGDEAFRGKLSGDIVKIAALTVLADDSVDEYERLMLPLVLLPLQDASAAAEFYDASVISPEMATRLLGRWNGLVETLKASGPDAQAGKFESIATAREKDAASGTAVAEALTAALSQFAECFLKADGTVTPAEAERLVQVKTLIRRTSQNSAGQTDAAVKTDTKAAKEEKPETLEELMAKIDDLVGMDNIKDEIRTFINLVQVQNERKARKMPVTPLSLHAVFYGPPGTGKTTIARILGKVYRAIGLLSKGQLVETDRAGLVAGFVGQTAIKADELVQKAMDGVLFIDEAYTLAPGGAGAGGGDFGREAIDTILKRMEDSRERLAVIVAGYPAEMERFIESNPGLKSRFSRYFYFKDYEPEQLLKIFGGFLKKGGYQLSETATAKLQALFGALYETRDRTFGNGRLARNLFEKIVERQANRIAKIAPLTDAVLSTFELDDVPSVEEWRNSK